MSAIMPLPSMLASLPMPPPDPLGYPVPVELLRALSYFTLTLHFLAMYFTLGGLALLLWVRLRRPSGADSLASYFAHALPLGFSYLVTLGIPPLLFVQVIYGQLFYSSSVLVGLPWIMVVPALITSYGLLYLHKLTRGSRPGRRSWLLAVALCAMVAVAFFYVNNITLSQTPDRWAAIYAAHPDGATLNLAEPTLLARLAFFLSPALTVAGIGLLVAAAANRRWRREAEADAFAALGLRAALAGTVALLLSAIWLVMALPDRVAARLTGGGLESALAAAGAALMAAAVVVLAVGHRRARLALPIAGATLFALGLAALVMLRDAVRIEYLAPWFDAAQVPVNAQWGMLVLFCVLLVLGLLLLATLTTMVVRNLTSGRAA